MMKIDENKDKSRKWNSELYPEYEKLADNIQFSRTKKLTRSSDHLFEVMLDKI